MTESLDIHISDSTAALVASKVQAIERLLDLARQGSLGYLDDRLYLRIQFDNDSVVWRSQILAAKLEMVTGSDQIWRKFVKGTLIITRRFYWETEAMQALEVSSYSTAATTGYATIYNGSDGGVPNDFSVAAAQVTGSLPAPAKIYIKNISGASRAFGTAYIGNYVFNDPTNIVPYYKAATASFSNTTPGPTTTETGIYQWAIGSALVNDFAGQFGRFVVVWSDRPAIATLIRAAIQVTATATFDLALGEQMLDVPNDFVQDLGALPIPPGGYIAGMGADMSFALKALPAAGVEDTLGVTMLHIFPSGIGRFRVVKGISNFSMGSNEEVIDDGPNNVTYSLSGAAASPLFRPLYSPIYLWPGRLNTMRLIISGGTTFEDNYAWGIKMEFRPRRLSF